MNNENESSLFEVKENSNHIIDVPVDKILTDKYKKIIINNTVLIIYLVDITEIDNQSFDLSSPLSLNIDNDIIILVLYIDSDTLKSIEQTEQSDKLFSLDDLITAISNSKYYLMIEISNDSVVEINNCVTISKIPVIFWITYAKNSLLSGINGVTINQKITLPYPIKISHTNDNFYYNIIPAILNDISMDNLTEEQKSYINSTYLQIRNDLELQCSSIPPDHEFLISGTTYGIPINKHPVFDFMSTYNLPDWIIFELMWKST
jgi:hypothetical protein